MQRFSIAEEKRISQEIELQSYLNNLIIEEKKRWTSHVKIIFFSQQVSGIEVLFTCFSSVIISHLHLNDSYDWY